MFKRTLVLLVALMTSLAACTVEPPLDQNVASDLKFRSVSVTTSGGQNALAQFGISQSRFNADLTAALTRELRAASKNGTRVVDVSFDVTTISFESVLPGALRTYPYSRIIAFVDIVDVRTGEVVLRHTALSGNDNLGAHGLGSAAKVTFSLGKEPLQAYNDTVAGFAADVRRQLLEWQGFMTAVN
jgi:hypothetical protein